MSEPPVFTVVVPTVGRPRYLEGCLAALAALDYARERYEVVIANDGGGEPTADVVARFAGELDVRTTEPARSGPSSARNAGAAAARGRFVAFTDDDCRPRPDWLTELERALAAEPGAGAGGVTLNGAPRSAGAAASQIVVDALHEQFNRDAPRFFASQNIALPAAGFAAVGGFDEGYRYGEDREFCARWLRSGRPLVAAPGALVDHMRTLSLGEFWRQHQGYGRGARTFARTRGAGGRGEDTGGVVRTMAAGARRSGSARVAAYVALSQVATTIGYARETLRPVNRPETGA
jgi:glycosyltransferase involved in cell wall biosynthesis